MLDGSWGVFPVHLYRSGVTWKLRGGDCCGRYRGSGGPWLGVSEGFGALNPDPDCRSGGTDGTRCCILAIII